jgi:hypothetical protein
MDDGAGSFLPNVMISGSAARGLTWTSGLGDLLRAKCVQLAIGSHKDTPLDRDGRLETTD